MQPATDNLIKPLTALRFYAAALVFGVHVSMLPGLEWMGHPGALLQGNIGVSIFFVLSGYIMSHVYFGERGFDASWPNSLRFIIARITRIFPLHLLTLVLCLPLAMYSTYSRLDPADLPVHVLLLQEFNPMHAFSSAPNKVAWTLSCELLFYLLTPPLFILLGRGRRVRTLLPLLLMLAIAAATLVFLNDPRVRTSAAPFRVADYLAGVLLFMWKPPQWLRSRLRGGLLILLGACWFTVLMVLEFQGVVTTDTTLVLLPGSLLVVAGVAGSRSTSSWFLASDLMVRLGMASFALYMVHELTLRYLRVVMIQLDVVLPLTASVLALVGVFLLVQWLSFVAHDRFESPLQRRGRAWAFSRLRIAPVKPPRPPVRRERPVPREDTAALVRIKRAKGPLESVRR